jgi:hypothetical protein
VAAIPAFRSKMTNVGHVRNKIPGARAHPVSHGRRGARELLAPSAAQARARSTLLVAM